MYREALRRRSDAFSDFWKRFQRHRPATASLYVLVGICIMAVFAPYISPYSPKKISWELLQGPSTEHLFGTDELGRDVFSRIIWGSRTSLFVGFSAGLLSILIGILIGTLSGYYGSWIDKALMGATDALIMLPAFALILLLVALFGGNLFNIILVMGLTIWPANARVVRAEFLALKEKEFVESARVIGASNRRIILREILPNAVPSIVIVTSLRIGYAVFTEASLSFLGLGDPNFVSWGQMLLSSYGFLRVAWWTSAFPGLAIFVTILTLNLIGDGLNDALNPRLRGR